MRIAVMGSGGVGGYFGARLAAAGHDVAFIARGAHLAAMQRDGLAVSGALGELRLRAVHATAEPAEVGPVDVVLFAVKLYDTDGAAARLQPLLGEATAVVNLQNGVDGEAALAAHLGAGPVMGGVAYVSSHVAAPGVIETAGRGARLVFGEADGTRSPRGLALEAACREAGVEAELVPDIAAAKWRKLVMLAPMSALACLTRLPLAELMAVPDTAALMRRAIEEVAAVAAAEGIDLAADTVERTAAIAAAASPGVKPSMLVDLERGRPLEVAGLSGAVVRRGQAAGVATPVHEVALAALAPFAAGQPGARRAAPS